MSILTNLKTDVENFFYWNVRLLPTQIQVAHNAKMVTKDPNYFTKKENNKNKFESFINSKKEEKQQQSQEEKDTKKENNEESLKNSEMKKADNLSKEINGDEQFTEKLKDDIVKLSGNDQFKRLQIINKALAAKKLIDYAYYYMTDNDAKLIKLNQTEKEICNAIANIFDFGKIYDSVGIADLKRYDFSFKNDYIETSKYLISIEDIYKVRRDAGFCAKVTVRKANLLAEKEHPEDDEPEVEKVDGEVETPEAIKAFGKIIGKDGVEKPIFMMKDIIDESEPEIELIQGKGISDEMFERLESVFKPILDKMSSVASYRYELNNNGLVTLFVKRPIGAEEYYTIDPGMIVGKDKYAILGRYMTGPNSYDTILVSEDHPEIIECILNSVFYVMSSEDVHQAMSDYFTNMNNYRYLDMSKTGFLKNLSPEEFQKLGKKITFILNKVKDQGTGPDLPRFRFNYWNGVDDFIIISDPSVKKPLAEVHENSDVICEGLMYQVKGDDVTQIYKGSKMEFHIDKYGEM